MSKKEKRKKKKIIKKKVFLKQIRHLLEPIHRLEDNWTDPLMDRVALKNGRIDLKKPLILMLVIQVGFSFLLIIPFILASKS